MRIYSDPVLNILYIETVSEGPVTDFQPAAIGDYVSVFRPMRNVYDLKNVHYSTIQDKENNSFLSAQAAADYISSLLVVNVPKDGEQGPIGPVGPTGPPGPKGDPAMGSAITTVYPLSLNTDLNQISVDSYYIGDGGNF